MNDNIQLITDKLKDAKIASEYMSDVEADNMMVFTKEETENILTDLTTLRKRVKELEGYVVHKAGCDAIKYTGIYQCTCGLDEIMNHLNK